jgi:glycosyltransferase involved in cell wall biosynthesis
MARVTQAPDLSLLIPIFNEADVVPLLLKELYQVLNRVSLTWEIVFIDDGSTDQTLNLLQSYSNTDERIVIVELSRNFGKEAALTAGFDICRGRAAIPMDADLQDPPDLIPDLVDKWQRGYDVVNAVRRSRRDDSLVKRFSAHIFYRMIGRLSPINLPVDTGDFRLLSRAVIEALKRMPERRRYMKGMFAWVGFKSIEVSYDRKARVAGKTNWNYFKLLNFAVEGITSFSSAPLRLAMYLGLVVALLSIIYAGIVVFKTIVWGESVAGYPSLMVALLFIGAMQLICIGIIGEYLGRVYDESKRRPIYLIKDIYCADYDKH